jgi:hypothetical protein
MRQWRIIHPKYQGQTAVQSALKHHQTTPTQLKRGTDKTPQMSENFMFYQAT